MTQPESADHTPPFPPLAQIPADMVAPVDYERRAQEHMPASVWAYVQCGATAEQTLADNRAAFKRVRLQQRVLRDLRGGHTRLHLVGHDLPYPILLAPVAYQKLMHPAGEIATAQGAAAMGATMVVSAQATTSLEDIAAVGAGPRWFQLPPHAERAFTLQLADRAHAAGYQALVLTVDAPVTGLKYPVMRSGFNLPAGVDEVNLRHMPRPQHTTAAGESPIFGSTLTQQAPTWPDVRWLTEHSPLPLLLKGITHAQDAALAVAHGAAGIIVSNHGGRSLDGLPATLDVLPAITQVVAGRIPLLLDGGIRDGGDVFKALALGAQAVLVGRLQAYALATAGAPGVAHLLQMLRTELEATMILTGCATLADIGPHALVRT